MKKGFVFKRDQKRALVPRLSEKSIEHAGDLFMISLGFSVIRFSQARATMQTPGIPDRRYYRPGGEMLPAEPGRSAHPRRPLVTWWEAKAPQGKQSPFQVAFQRMCESCGETYLVGTDTVLHEWALGAGLVERAGDHGFRRL